LNGKNRMIVCHIPGLGDPYLGHKLEIIGNNLEILCQELFQKNTTFLKCLVLIRTYENQHYGLIQDWIEWYWKKRFPMFTFVLISFKGYLGEYMDKYRYLTNIENVKYWIWMLDDVQWSRPFCFEKAFHHMKKYNIDILSPAIRYQCPFGHRFMKWDKDTGHCLLRQTNFIELFTFICTSSACQSLWKLLPPGNKYIWGLDLLLYPYGHLNLAIDETLIIWHYYSSKNGDEDTYKDMNIELKTMNRQYPKNIKFRFKTLKTLYKYY